MHIPFMTGSTGLGKWFEGAPLTEMIRSVWRALFNQRVVLVCVFGLFVSVLHGNWAGEVSELGSVLRLDELDEADDFQCLWMRFQCSSFERPTGSSLERQGPAPETCSWPGQMERPGTASSRCTCGLRPCSTSSGT